MQLIVVKGVEVHVLRAQLAMHVPIGNRTVLSQPAIYFIDHFLLELTLGHQPGFDAIEKRSTLSEVVERHLSHPLGQLFQPSTPRVVRCVGRITHPVLSGAG